MAISYEDFISACPSATTPSAEIYKRVLPLLWETTQKLRGFVGSDLFDKIIGEESLEAWLLKKLISLDTYYEAIPQLDLVLTSTGFGIVSNQNLAPASADRVERLLKQIDISRQDTKTQLVSLLRKYPEWNETDVAHFVIQSLFWNKNQLYMFGIEKPTMDDLDRMRPDITAAEQLLENVIGHEQLDELIDLERTDEISGKHNELATLCKKYIVAIIKPGKNHENARLRILSFLDRNLADFNLYENSDAYRANHHKRYENKKDDPCFFFG